MQDIYITAYLLPCGGSDLWNGQGGSKESEEEMTKEFIMTDEIVIVLVRLIKTINHKNEGNADEADVQRALGQLYQICIEGNNL